MAIAIYQDLQGRQYWADSTSESTGEHLADGSWVLYDDTPGTPPLPPVDPFDDEVAERIDNLTSKTSVRLRAASVAAVAESGAFGTAGRQQVRRAVRRRLPDLVKLTAGGGTIGGGAGSTVSDATDLVQGASAAKIVTDGAGGFGNYKFAAVGPWDMTSRTLRLVLKIENYANLSFAALDVGDATLANRFTTQISETSLRDSIRVAREGEWLILDVPKSAFTVNAGAPSWSAIAGVRIAAVDKNTGGACTVHVNSISAVPAHSALPNGAVVFTFDDSSAAHFSIAKAQLDLYGAPGVAFPITDASGLPVAQLKTMRDYSGWEIGAHALSSADHANVYTGLTAAQVEARFEQLKAWHATHGFGGDVFAWPSGDSDATSEEVARRYFTAARGTAGGLQSSAFPNPMRVRTYNTAGASLPTAQTWIDSAKSSREVAVVLTHDIVTSGATGSQSLSSVVTGLIDYAAAQAVPIMTLSGVLKTVGLT